MIIGFFESYREGFAPSMMPPWLVARDEAEEVVGFAVTVWVTIDVITLAMMSTATMVSISTSSIYEVDGGAPVP